MCSLYLTFSVSPPQYNLAESISEWPYEWNISRSGSTFFEPKTRHAVVAESVLSRPKVMALSTYLGKIICQAAFEKSARVYPRVIDSYPRMTRGLEVSKVIVGRGCQMESVGMPWSKRKMMREM